MRLAMLARNARLYSHQRLVASARSRGHEIDVINTLHVHMNITSNRPTLRYGGETLPLYDAVIPRIGASITHYGLAVLRQFEMQGVYPLNESVAIGRSRDKLRALQLLAREGIGLPVTAFAHGPRAAEDVIKEVGGTPVVIKLLEGTQGMGVVLAETEASAKSIIEAFSAANVNIMVQEFIREAEGSDIRAFVVGGRVVAAMKRTGNKGEFRSNLHRGGKGEAITLTSEENRCGAALGARARHERLRRRYAAGAARARRHGSQLLARSRRNRTRDRCRHRRTGDKVSRKPCQARRDRDQGQQGVGDVNFTEHAGKAVLAAAGIPVPNGIVADNAEAAAVAAEAIGPCVIKAQVPAGKRGKAGGIKLAATAGEARAHAISILALTIGDHRVERVLVDPQVAIGEEFYAAVLNDPASQGPLVLFSFEGGMDIEELVATRPESLIRLPVDIRAGITPETIAEHLGPASPSRPVAALSAILAKLYAAYAANDCELVEINPLVLTRAGDLIALDCKLSLDDGAIPRRETLAATSTPEKLTDLERRAQALHLKFIELDGNVGVLANGAGLTMTTMDAISHFGGKPANFLEIGGESYTKAKPALELVLANPNVKALLVNFCGAFARTDVMAEGVITAWLELKPKIPIIFTIHGTGEDEAIAMVKERLGIEPYDVMDDAVKAAVAAAKGSPRA